MVKRWLISSFIAALTSDCIGAILHRGQPSLQIAGDVVHGNLVPEEGQNGSPILKLRQQYPWYRTSDDIQDALRELAGDCSNADFSISIQSHDDASAKDKLELDVVRVRKSNHADKRKLKALFVFGEHARELISPEAGLKFLQTVCDADSNEAGLVHRVLENFDFVLVPNANPLGRKKVEAGEFCKRTNEDGVDLNRNWGENHHENRTSARGQEMDPGPSGFSEPETKMIRDLVLDEKPDIFLSVHSGAYLLATPFGYSSSRKPFNEQRMIDVLRPISQQFCNGDCPVGSLGELLSYQSKGCDIDWVSENLKTPFIFTWEIYVGRNFRGYYVADAHTQARNHTLGKPPEDGRTSLDLIQARPYRLRGKPTSSIPGLDVWSANTKQESQQKPSECFRQFNPESQEETEEVSQNWALAFLTLCDEVRMKM